MKFLISFFCQLLYVRRKVEFLVNSYPKYFFLRLYLILWSWLKMFVCHHLRPWTSYPKGPYPPPIDPRKFLPLYLPLTFSSHNVFLQSQFRSIQLERSNMPALTQNSGACNKYQVGKNVYVYGYVYGYECY